MTKNLIFLSETREKMNWSPVIIPVLRFCGINVFSSSATPDTLMISNVMMTDPAACQ